MTSGVYRGGAFLDDNVALALQLPNLAAIPVGLSKISVSLTPTAVAANTSVEQSFTVPGLNQGDWVELTPPGLTNGVCLANARVSAAGTLQLQFINSTGGSLTPPSGVHSILICR